MPKPGWPKPIDILSTAFLASLFALTLINYRAIPDAANIALRYAGAVLMVLTASYARRRYPESALLKYIDTFLPLFIVLFTFDSLSRLTHYVNPADKDAALARLDGLVFGVQPGVWMQGMIYPMLTTVLQLCYTSYYFLPVVFCVILFARGDMEEFNQSVFGIVLGFFISYIGYLLVPALGPRSYLDGAFSHDLMRGPLAAGINNILNTLEGENRDAFPSGHTEVVLIVLFYAWRYGRWYFWLALPLVSGLIFSTVYLRYHYAVDVLAGVALAPVSVWAASRLYGLSLKSPAKQKPHDPA